MFIDLETERLFLKCIGYDDTEFFYKQFTTDEVNQYLFDIEPFDSMKKHKNGLASIWKANQGISKGG